MKRETVRCMVGMILGAAIPLGLFWLGGFEFNTRGSTAGWCGAITIIGMVLGYAAGEDAAEGPEDYG